MVKIIVGLIVISAVMCLVFLASVGINSGVGLDMFSWSTATMVAVALLALGARLIYKKRFIWGSLSILLAFLMLGFFGVNRVQQTVTTTVEKAGNLITTGNTLTPEQQAAALKAEAERVAREEKARKDEELHQAKVRGTEAAAYDAEVAKNLPLTKAAFTTRTAGKFETLKIRSGTTVGPINMYAACNTRWTKTGIGMIKILTRPDETSKPAEATLNDYDYGIKETAHKGKPIAQMFFEAVQGDIQIEMIRFDNGTNKENPCK